MAKTQKPLDVWLRIPEFELDGVTPNLDDTADAEANVYFERAYRRFRADWSLTAVGLVKSRYFDTYQEARAWLESEGFQDFSS